MLVRQNRVQRLAEGSGVDHGKLLDDTEATNWADLLGPVRGSRVTVNLAGSSRSVRHINVSALLRPEDANDIDSGGQNRFTALRQFEIWTCNQGADPLNLLCLSALDAGFTLLFASPADAFPGVAPRPTAPALILREFDVPDTVATHVQLRVLDSQCTGGPAFQGEQDQDPLNSTDCDANSSSGSIVRAAELQVYATLPEVPPLN